MVGAAVLGGGQGGGQGGAGGDQQRPAAAARTHPLQHTDWPPDPFLLLPIPYCCRSDVHQRTLVDSRYASALVKLVEQSAAATAGAAARDGQQQQQGGQAAADQERSMQSVFYALMDLAGFTGGAPAGGLGRLGAARLLTLVTRPLLIRSVASKPTD